MDIKGLKVYLSGPVTGLDRKEVVEAFKAAKRELKAQGAAEVWSPPEKVPAEADYSRAMRICMQALSRDKEDDPLQPYFDLLVRLPGWQTSSGCVTETRIAGSGGVRVVDLTAVMR